MKKGSNSVIIGICLTILIFTATILPTGKRSTTTIENIASIAFPVTPQGTAITEALAHTNIQLKEPVFAKKAIVTVTYIPHSTKQLALGIRENSFWYSYMPIPFFEAQAGAGSDTAIKKAVIEIPLTDKLADTDQTIDMLFIANGPIDPTLLAAQPTQDTTYWQLVDLQVTVAHSIPSTAEFKDFVRSILSRERVI